MSEYILVVIGSTLLTLFSIPLLIKCGGLSQDVPNLRSSHAKITPRGAGLVFISIALIVSYSISSELRTEYYLSISIISIFLLGLLEDKVGVSAKIRLLVQFFISVFTVYSGIYWNTIGGGELPINLYFFTGAILSILWMVWATNLYNFMDGINGIAAFQSIVLCILLAKLTWDYHLYDLTILLVSLLGGLLGFLPFNFPKAKIFGGDSFSLFFGFTFSIIFLRLHQIDRHIDLIWAIYSIAPFFIDSSITLLRRFIKRENILTPHRSHVYQKMADLVGNHWIPTLIYFTFAITFSTIAYVRISQIFEVGIYLFCAPIFVFTLMMYIVEKLHFNKNFVNRVNSI